MTRKSKERMNDVGEGDRRGGRREGTYLGSVG